MNLVKTSYSRDDVMILLTDITADMKPLNTAEREALIQKGVHYSEMLPLEQAPSQEYLNLYHNALSVHKHYIAELIASLAYRIKRSTSMGKAPVLVSLARAGIPIGVLIKRYLCSFLGCSCSHYAISIVRDKGIDINAMDYIYEQEVASGRAKVSDIFFIDGWTGKGAIFSQLEDSIRELKKYNSKWSALPSRLYVLADPANITENCGTHEDFLIPTSCLNSTVSGLISRSIVNDYIDIQQGDFHGAAYHKAQKDNDLSNDFLNIVTECFKKSAGKIGSIYSQCEKGIDVVRRICRDFDIEDYYKVKPGIGETTRVLLRRIPWGVLINENVDLNDPDLSHIKVLCSEKGVPILRYNLGNYKTCGIIKELSADA